ncbi:hypothetical protein HDV00_001219 [Rhizophlyctis rosea]|nr:hypothetical protein HDV00_001219 [Rhizophlyctis rosea]
MRATLLALSALAGAVTAQQVGTSTAESHPKLTISTCTTGGTCTTAQRSVVLDANWRWTHTTSGYTNCYSGSSWDTTLCPDPVTCAKNCAIDGADYANTYGITTSGNSLNLKWATTNANGVNVGVRTYLMDSSDSKYEMLKLVNKEFAFDVDMTKADCGLNGALYLSEMAADGGLSAYSGNKAGAKYGTGYCDSQCPHDIKFINGEANTIGWGGTGSNTGSGKYGTCCHEMDIWEANKHSSAYTPHPCNTVGQVRCTSDAECGDSDRYGGLCDKDGCDINPFRLNVKDFYGPGNTVDTNKPLTVITQFISSDGTDSGDLVEIRRKYIQNGVTYDSPFANYPEISKYDSITDNFCADAKSLFQNTNDFAAKGGLKAMGEALKRGMVLVMSVWADDFVQMLWLDSNYPTDADPSIPGVARGTCPTTSGKSADMQKSNPDSAVKFSNIKWGPIGSTYNTGPVTSRTSTTSARTTTTTTRSSTTSTTTTRTSTTSGCAAATVTVTQAAQTVYSTVTVTSTVGSGTTQRTTTTTTRPPTTTTTTTSQSQQTNCAAKYGQCGGQGYSGATCCQSGSTCKVSNQYYSQCL